MRLKGSVYFLENFLDKKGIYALLQRKGVSAAASSRLAAQYAKVAQALLDRGHPLLASTEACWVPGRIEVLGKHTDYAGGASLLVAAEQGFSVLIIADEGEGVTCIDALTQEQLELDDNGNVVGRAPPWSVYPATACRRIKANFGERPGGGDIAFASNLPAAAGMSSSSAFIIAVCLGLQSLWGYQNAPAFHSIISGSTEFADYMGHVENGQTYKALEGDKGVGTFGGSQDHTAILCAKPRHLMYTRFKPTEIQSYVSIPEALTFCIASSGVKAEKTAGALALYNQAADSVTRILEIWNAEAHPKIKTLAGVIQAPAFDKRAWLTRLSKEKDDLAGRFEQFYNETERYIPEAIRALASSDYEQLGRLVDASQTDAERLLKNQIPETSFLVGAARHAGAVAASAFGAGFGGSVWALVERREADVFLAVWQKQYLKKFPELGAAQFFQDQTGPAAFWLGDVD